MEAITTVHVICPMHTCTYQIVWCPIFWCACPRKLRPRRVGGMDSDQCHGMLWSRSERIATTVSVTQFTYILLEIRNWGVVAQRGFTGIEIHLERYLLIHQNQWFQCIGLEAWYFCSVMTASTQAMGLCIIFWNHKRNQIHIEVAVESLRCNALPAPN